MTDRAIARRVTTVAMSPIAASGPRMAAKLSMARSFGFVGECTAPKRATPASASLKPSIAPSARPEHRGSRSETMGAVP